MNLVSCGMNFMNVEMSLLCSEMNLVVGEMSCMDLGENFVLRQNQVMKSFQVKNWEVRLGNFA